MERVYRQNDPDFGCYGCALLFPGSNSRVYQIANRISATLRQGLLLHEIVGAMRQAAKTNCRTAD